MMLQRWICALHESALRFQTRLSLLEMRRADTFFGRRGREQRAIRRLAKAEFSKMSANLPLENCFRRKRADYAVFFFMPTLP
jgi:hypothetical protein